MIWALTFVSVSALAGCAFLAASLLAARRAPVDVEALKSELRSQWSKATADLAEERAQMRVQFAASLEEAASLSDAVDRHRARVEQAEARRAKREAKDAPAAAGAAPGQMLTIMDVHRAARAAGKL